MRSVSVVYLLVVVYSLCYQLQSPLEPFLVEKLATAGTDSAAAYARLQSFFAVVQMVGSFFVGYLLDRLGLRVMFALNFFGCAASYALLARADTLEALYLSKLPAVFMAGFLCAQVAVAKLTPDGSAERTAALARLTSAYTVGGVIGPALGGQLGVTTAAKLAVAGSLLAVGLVMLLPTDEEKPAEGSGDGAASTGGSASAAGVAPAETTSFVSRVRTILAMTGPLLLTKLGSGLVNSSMGATRPLLLKNEFSFDAARLGAFMSASFFGAAIVGLKLDAITSRLGGELRTIVACLKMMCAGYLVMGAAFEPLALGLGRQTAGGGVWLYSALSLALALFQFPLATTVTALSTSAVPPSLKGTLVGTEHAIFALASLIGPVCGVFVLERAGLAGCAAVASASYGGLYVAWRLRAEARARPPSSPPPPPASSSELLAARRSSPRFIAKKK